MNIDFNFLKKSIGKELKFEAKYLTKENGNFLDRFYATLREVKDDFIIVEQYIVQSDENENYKIVSNKRKLQKGVFTIDTNEIPLNG